MRPFRLVGIITLFLSVRATQAQTVSFGNFNTDLTGTGALIGNVTDFYRRLAVPFTTPPVRQFVFHSFEAPISGNSGLLQITLAADNNGVPGATLTTSLQAVSSSFVVRRWYAGGQVLLEGNTRYWIIAPSSGTGQFTWTSAPVNNNAGGTLHSISGGDWVPIYAGSTTPADRINATIAMGVCCSPQLGSCLTSSVADCDALHHTFFTGAACGPSPCPPAPLQAACCNPASAACTVTSQTVCETLGGRWSEGSPACEPFSCPITFPDGACCAQTNCTLLPVFLCAATRGRFLGNGTTCAAISGVNVCCPTDLNNSGEITVQDLFDYLAGFFARCP